jgi:hypothetical protein
MSTTVITVEELRDAVAVYNALIAKGYDLENDKYSNETVEHCMFGRQLLITTSINPNEAIFIDDYF